MPRPQIFIQALSCFALGLLPAGPVQAQDNPVHGTVQSVSGQTVTVQLKEGYRVEPGTEGIIYDVRTTSGQETSVNLKIRVQKVSGSSATARLREKESAERGREVRFANVHKVRKKAPEKRDTYEADSVDKEPKLKGGPLSLVKQLKYPDQARRQGVEGTVYVQVIVNEDGTVREAKVLQGLGAAVDEEALRVATNAGFIPAKHNGKNVPVRKTLEFKFRQ